MNKTHETRLFRFAHRKLSNYHLAEDVLQKVRIKLWQKMPKHLSEEEQLAYSYQSLNYRCIDYIRSLGSKKKKLAKVIPLSECQIKCPRPNPYENLELKEDINMLNEAISKLRECERQILEMIMNGKKAKEIAIEMNSTEGSINARISHARKKVRKYLDRNKCLN